MKRSPIQRGTKRLARHTPLPRVTKDPDKRRRLKARRDRQFGRDDAGDFAAFVRSFGCLVGRLTNWRTGCETPIEAAHLRSRGAHPSEPGVGNLVPLCRAHHRQQHELERLYDIELDLRSEAIRLAGEWARAR